MYTYLSVQKKKTHKAAANKKDRIRHGSSHERAEATKVESDRKETKNKKIKAKAKDGSNLNYQFGKYGVIREVQ